MSMKEARLKAEIIEDENGVVVVFNVIKPLKGQPKEFLKVTITPDKLTAELNELNYFAFQEFQYSRIDTEIAC